jgi:hypothetical protein
MLQDLLPGPSLPIGDDVPQSVQLLLAVVHKEELVPAMEVDQVFGPLPLEPPKLGQEEELGKEVLPDA